MNVIDFLETYYLPTRNTTQPYLLQSQKHLKKHSTRLIARGEGKSLEILRKKSWKRS